MAYARNTFFTVTAMLVTFRTLKIKAESPYERREGLCGSGVAYLHSLSISVLGDNK